MKFMFSIILVFFSLVSMVFAEDFKCSAVKVIENSNGEFGLSWETPAGELLKSWRIEFTLNGSYVSTGDIFWTFYSPTSSIRKNGITLSVTEALQLEINHDGNVVTTGAPWLISGKSYTMAFQFVLFENNEGLVQKGEFSIVSGNQILSFVIEDSSVLDFCAFRKSYDNSKVTRFHNLAGAYKYSNVSLYYLSNRVIPEPSTAVLIVVSITLLSTRRRR